MLFNVLQTAVVALCLVHEANAHSEFRASLSLQDFRKQVRVFDRLDNAGHWGLTQSL